MTSKTWFENSVDQAKDDFDFRLEGYILDLTRQICNLMESKKITRSELAKRLNVSKSYVTEILTGTPNLTLESILKLSDAIGGKLQISMIDSAADPQLKSEWKAHYSGIMGTSYELSGPITIAVGSFEKGVSRPMSENWVTSFKFLAPPKQIPSKKQTHKEGDDLEVNSVDSSSVAA